MVRLQRIGGGEDATIFVKMELLNPCFSVKDRIGVGMIERGGVRRKRELIGGGGRLGRP